MQELAFRTLLYRYFFFDWLFKDVSRGDLMARAAAWRFNQSRAHWLLTYMRRWLWCGVLFYGLGCAVASARAAKAASPSHESRGCLRLHAQSVCASSPVWLQQEPCAIAPSGRPT